LQLLEQQVVGGEQSKNKDLKEKHKRRKRYADERKKQLVAALQNSDEDSGDWVLLNVYDSIQEEVRAKSKLLEKMQRKVRPWPRHPSPTSVHRHTCTGRPPSTHGHLGSCQPNYVSCWRAGGGAMSGLSGWGQSSVYEVTRGTQAPVFLWAGHS
jgi:hypothetical protein